MTDKGKLRNTWNVGVGRGWIRPTGIPRWTTEIKAKLREMFLPE
jgi:hypothetical protein